jgi:hypothetical protein
MMASSLGAQRTTNADEVFGTWEWKRLRYFAMGHAVFEVVYVVMCALAPW